MCACRNGCPLVASLGLDPDRSRDCEHCACACASACVRASVIVLQNGAPPASGVGPDGDVGHMHSVGHGQYIRRNWPYRGWKTQIWEGGVRVAGFIHSPLLPSKVRGTVSQELYHVTDWLPTIASLTGTHTQAHTHTHTHRHTYAQAQAQA